MSFFEWIQSIDLAAVRFVREYATNEFLDFLMPLVTLIGEDGILWICVTLIMLMFRKTRKAGFVMGLSLAIGFVLVNLGLKPLVDRPRPYEIDVGVEILVHSLSDGSFPSGHTLACFEAATSLLLCKYKRAGAVALVSAFAVAVSRVYLYVHFPTDVMVGAVLGVIFAIIANIVVNKLYEKKRKLKTL